MPEDAHSAESAHRDGEEAPAVTGGHASRAPSGAAGDDAGDGARRDGDTIGVNATYALLAQLAGAAFTAVLTLFLARKLGTHGFGIYSLALGVSALLLFPSDFGVSTAAARFIAERRGDRAAVASVLADSVRLKLLASIAMSALLFVLASPIASAYGAHSLVWPLRAVAIALLGQSAMQMVKVFAALARVRLQLTTALVESAVETAATLALVIAGAGVTGAAFGRAIGYLVGGLMTLVLLARLVGPRSLPRGLRFGPHTRRIATYGGVILATDGAFTLFNQVDVLIIGGYLTASAVGIFSAPLRLTAFLGYPGNAISSGVSPRLARRSREGPDVAAFVGALRVLLMVQVITTAFVLGWAPLIVRVALGTHYGGSVEVLRVLAPFVFLLGFGPLVSGTVNYLGEARRRVPIAFATTATNIAIDFVLVPRIGVVGGAIGTDVAYALYAPAHLMICQRALGLDLRATAQTLGRTFAAGAAATGVLLLIGAPLSQPWVIVLGGIAALSLYVLVLLATREVDRAEIAWVLEDLMRRRELRGDRVRARGREPAIDRDGG
jgi:O-antigen/teichoic acid export membrane protein